METGPCWRARGRRTRLRVPMGPWRARGRHTCLSPCGTVEGTGQAHEAESPWGPGGCRAGAGGSEAPWGRGWYRAGSRPGLSLYLPVCPGLLHRLPCVTAGAGTTLLGTHTSEVFRKAPLRPFPNSRMTPRLHDVNEPLVPQAALWAGCGTLPPPGRSGLLVLLPSDGAGRSIESRSIA